MKINKIIIALILPAMFAYSCKSVYQYADSDGPVFTDQSISSTQDNQDRISVVIFNIQYGEKMDLARKEILEDSRFKYADLILLQEVSDEGVQKFAKSMGMNYVYYPISKTKDFRNLGNAILSKTAILEPHKLLLPHEKYNKRRRHAPNGIVEFKGKKILVYSIHNETIPMLRRKRLDQIEALIKDIKLKQNHVDAIVVGGDFNTLLKGYRNKVVSAFESVGLDWATKEIGGTSSAFFNLVHPSNDHFFIYGLQLESVDKKADSHASDHLPIVVNLRF